MRVHGGADGQVFMEVAASQDAADSGAGRFTWNPGALPEELLDGAYDTANTYFETTMPGGDDGATFDLATAVLGKDAVDRIVAQGAQDKQVLDYLVAVELMVMEAIQGEAHGFMRPTISFASLDPGVNGYFEPGKPGSIVLSHDLKTRDPEFVDRVVLEELGEALVDHLVTDRGVVPGEGDVGNRLMKVFLGEPFAEGDFEAKNSDKVWISGDQQNASAEEPTAAELAAKWGVTEAEATDALAIAEENFSRRDAEFLWADDPAVDNEAEWGRFVTIYGNGNKIGVNGMARAIIDGAMKIADNNVNENAFNGIDLTLVSNHTLTDKIWEHAEDAAGPERSQISLRLLSDAVAYVTGDAAGFADNGTNWETIQDNFADITVNGETRQSGAEGPTRFSVDAIQSIWDSGAFTVTGYPADGSITIEVDAAAAETSTDPVDRGLLDQGYSAFGDPEGAENISMHFTDGDDTYHGFDVLHQRYTLADEPDVTFYTRMHAEEGEDFLVVEALKVNEETGDIQIFDSEGTETFTGNRSDFAPETRILTVDEILHDGSDAEAELVEWAGDDLLYSAATSQVSYVLYSEPDRAIDEYTYADTTTDILMIRYVVPTYDEATGTMIYSEARSVEADSPEGKNIITAANYAGKADLLAQEVEADETGEGVSETVVFDIDTTDVDPNTGQVAMADSVVMGAAAAAGAQQSENVAAAFFVPEIIVPAAIAGVAYGGWRVSHQFAEWQMNHQSGKVHVIEATMNAEDAPGGSGGGASADTTHTPNSQRGPTVGTVRKMPPGDGSDGDDPVPPPGGTTVKTHYVEMPDTLTSQLEQLDNIVEPARERFINAIMAFANFRGAVDDYVQFRQTGEVFGQPDATLARLRTNMHTRAEQFYAPMRLLQQTMRDLRTLDATMGDSLLSWFQQNLNEGGLTARGAEQMRRVMTLLEDVGDLEAGITATNGRMVDLWVPFAESVAGTDIPDAALATVRTALDESPTNIVEPPLQSNVFWARITAGIDAMNANPEAHRHGEEGEI